MKYSTGGCGFETNMTLGKQYSALTDLKDFLVQAITMASAHAAICDSLSTVFSQMTSLVLANNKASH